MKVHSCFLLVFISLLINTLLNKSAVKCFVKVTSISCESLDKKFADFQTCRLSVPRRSEISMAVHVRLFKVPVNNVSINLSLWRKSNDYRPFLYNVTVDFCKFLENKARMPFVKIVTDAFTVASNINHTCPFNHDIIVRNFVVNDQMFRFMPLPDGEYKFKLLVGAYNEFKAEVITKLFLRLNKS